MPYVEYRARHRRVHAQVVDFWYGEAFDGTERPEDFELPVYLMRDWADGIAWWLFPENESRATASTRLTPHSTRVLGDVTLFKWLHLRRIVDEVGRVTLPISNLCAYYREP
jgi:hypothetical protein